MRGQYSCGMPAAKGAAALPAAAACASNDGPERGAPSVAMRDEQRCAVAQTRSEALTGIIGEARSAVGTR